MTEHKCPKCGKDEVSVCPICGKQVDVYSRIVGYLRPIKTWNPGKVQEFIERKEYQINERWHNE
jgi:ribonucleoside-triphosphate reductase (formate)